MGLTDDQIYSVLKTVLDRVGNADITWRMNGSSNLRLLGMDIEVNDIDISTNTAGADVFKQALGEYLVKDYFKEKINCRVLLFVINSAEFEICVYKDERAMYDKVQKIQWNGLTVPVLPLRNARDFYLMVGLTEKAELIREYMEKTRRKNN
ncbi:hypothetical protein KY362_05130 [Candidatus Woesearchaeota archaeon]|nr:hypothetical protein [Candidatus Woesearchaeota archaeon]